jgi:large subunit ribosomal protein L25
MKTIELNAKKREVTGKKVKTLREKGSIPAVMYGSDAKPQNLEINTKEFNKIYQEAGTSSLVDLKVDGTNTKVLIHEPQMDPVKDVPIHVDLYKVKMSEKITTAIPIEFIGESPAVKDLEGNLITSKDEIEVECLPGDLISEIKVDISALKTFDDMVYVKSLNLPSTIEVLDDPEDIIAQVTPPRSEEELEQMEAEATTDQEKEQIEKIEAEAEAGKEAKEGEEETAKEESKSEENK